MKDRIQEILNSQNLTRTRLAEILNIQASAITHIINGRNKPSMDVIQSILVAFPSINPDWLILGSGNMYRNDNQQSIPQSVTIKSTKSEPFMPSLFDDLPDDKTENETLNELKSPVRQALKPAPKTAEERNATMGASGHGQYDTPDNRAGSLVGNSKQEPIQPQPEQCPPQRSITRIIVFYSDNTFEEMSK